MKKILEILICFQFGLLSIFANSPSWPPAVKITSLQVIGTPTVGDTVQLSITYTGFLNANANLKLYFPGSFVPIDQMQGETIRTIPIVLSSGTNGNLTFQFKVLNDGNSMVAAFISLANTVPGYSQVDSWFLTVETLGSTYTIFDDRNPGSSTNVNIYPSYGAQPTTQSQEAMQPLKGQRMIMPQSSQASPQPMSSSSTLPAHTVSVTGKLAYLDPHQYQTITVQGVYGVPVYLYFVNPSTGDWWNPIYTTGCNSIRHEHYDIAGPDGSFSFSLSFNADLTGYTQLLVIPGRANDAVWLPEEQNGIQVWCSSGTFFVLSDPAEGKKVTVTPSSSNINITGLNPQINPNDGAIFRNAELAREFVWQRYSQSLPFSIPLIFAFRTTEPAGNAGDFVTSFGNSPHLEFDNSWCDLTTVSHEFGHYVNYQMWNGYINTNGGCTDLSGKQTSTTAGQIYKEGWAVFYSFCTRNYANSVYGDDIRYYDDNMEQGPYQNPRFSQIRYSQTNPDISAWACYLWNVYDGYADGNFKSSATYHGDNDDVSGKGLYTFETMRTQIRDCPASYHLAFKSSIDNSLAASVDNIYGFIVQNSPTPMRPAQVTNLSYQQISAQDVRLTWATQSYPSELEANLPAGYRIYYIQGTSKQLVGTVPYGTNTFDYFNCDPLGQFSVTAYNGAGESYGAPTLTVTNATVSSTVNYKWNITSVPLYVVKDFRNGLVLN